MNTNSTIISNFGSVFSCSPYAHKPLKVGACYRYNCAGSKFNGATVTILCDGCLCANSAQTIDTSKVYVLFETFVEYENFRVFEERSEFLKKIANPLY